MQVRARQGLYEGHIVVDQPVAELRRRFLGRKVITIQSATPSVTGDLLGVTRRATEAHTTVLVVDTGRARLEQGIAVPLAQGGINDVTLGEPPLGVVLHDIIA